MRGRTYRNMTIAFLLPAFLLYSLLFIYPALRAFYVSMNDWSGFTPTMRFVGLANFVELLHDAYFWRNVIPTTVKIIFLGGVMVFALAFLLSGILSTRLKGKAFFRGILFFPSLVSQVAIAILWGFIYNTRWGLLNSLLRLVGLGRYQQTWTSADNLFGAVLFVLVWMNVGFYCVILLAALDRIPPDFNDAAKVEGAGELVIFFRIKIPLIWDVLVNSLVLWGISAVKTFGLLYVWTGAGGSTPVQLQNLAVYMYITAFGRKGGGSYRMGYATSLGVFMFLMIAALYLLISLINRKERIEY